MQILIVRHAKAMEREDFAKTGQDDALRPLTPDGARQMVKVARALAKIQPDVEEIWTSPFVRARETARLLQEAFGHEEIHETSILEPEKPVAPIFAQLKKTNIQTLCLVGHEPALSCFIGSMLSGEHTSLVKLKKGGAALIEFEKSIAPGKARLVWLMEPAHMRRLSEVRTGKARLL